MTQHSKLWDQITAEVLGPMPHLGIRYYERLEALQTAWPIIEGALEEQRRVDLEPLRALVGYHEQRAADRSDLHPMLALACPVCASTPYHDRSCPLQAAQRYLGEHG